MLSSPSPPLPLSPSPPLPLSPSPPLPLSPSPFSPPSRAILIFIFSEPIGPLAVTTAQPTHNSIAVELFRPANVPYLTPLLSLTSCFLIFPIYVVPVTYTVIVSPEGSVAIYNYSFLRSLNSSIQLLVSGLKPGSAYLMNVSTSLGQTISTPFLTANLSPPTFKYLNMRSEAKRREEKGREGKGREGKGREGKGREEKR